MILDTSWFFFFAFAVPFVIDVLSNFFTSIGYLVRLPTMAEKRRGCIRGIREGERGKTFQMQRSTRSSPELAFIK